MNLKHAILMISMILLQKHAIGQPNSVDVVYLHNGSLIKGVIVEQIPNQTIKLQTADGNIFVFKFEEIDKILKEQLSLINTNQSASVVCFSLHAGVALPIGDLGATSGDNAGFAKSGPCVGFQFSNVTNGLFIGVGGSANQNKVDTTEMRRDNNIPDYVTIDVANYRSQFAYLMIGLGAVDVKTQVYLSPLFGISNFTSPKIAFYDGFTDVTEPETSATSIIYGCAAGINIKHGISFGIKYITMEPEFDVKIFSEGMLILDTKTKSRMSMLHFTVGAAF